MSTNSSADVHIAELTADTRQVTEAEDQKRLLKELAALYDDIAGDEEETAGQLRQLLSLAVENDPDLLADKNLESIIGHQPYGNDAASFYWKSPVQVLLFCQKLYGFEYKSPALIKQVEKQVQTLLRHTLHQFEHQGELEKMFQLFWLVPDSLVSRDPELQRLRNRAYTYEMSRVQRYRRILYTYLLLQLFLITLIFPFLFINAENGVIQQEIEQATEVELAESRHQLLSYTDGLYWAVITAASIGYGDIAPVTGIGRVIAAVLGIMGVVTVGIIAGLVLQWILPRRL